MTLFPNRVKEKFTLSLNGFEMWKNVEVLIFDLSGKSLYKQTAIGVNEITIDVSTYSSGKYIVKASQGVRVGQKQFIME
jgi:hypothetical protein